MNIFQILFFNKIVTGSSNNLKAQSRSNRGRRGKGRGPKGSRCSTNNSPDSSDARDHHPLSATATSCGAVKRNVGEKDGKAPTTADGAKRDKKEKGTNGICYVQTL